MTRATLRLGLAIILYAAAGQAPSAQQRPVFRTDVNFVTVDAYPLVAGRVIEGLTRDDFEVREDGRPQVIESFDFVRADARLTESERREPDNQQQMLDQVADPRSRVFVAFLDVHHVDVSGAFYSRQPLQELFDRLLAPSDLIALATSRNNPRQLTFGRRSTVVSQQLKDFWTWREPDVTENDAEEHALLGCFAEIGGELVQRRRQDQLLSTLEGLVEYLGEVREGRKTVFLFSQGWTWIEPKPDLLKVLNRPEYVAPLGPTITNEPWRNMRAVTRLDEGGRATCETELRRLAALNSPPRFRQLLRDATMANVVVYPVDPTGVGGGRRTDRLLEFASNTGGTAVYNRNDLVQGVIDVSREFSGYYLLGYASDNRKTDGNLRRIDVKVKRPGVEVKARRGYRALTTEEAASRSAAVGSTTATIAPAAGPSPVGRALDVLSRMRRADDGTFSVEPYLKADAAPILGVPAVFRATPSPRSPLVPVTAPVFRRSERLHIEWPVEQTLTERTARVLARDGTPLAVVVTVTAKEGAAGSVLMADAVLGALAPGDYLIEVQVTSAAGVRTALVAFRVVP